MIYIAVRCDLNVSRPTIRKQTVKFRKLRNINFEELRNEILSSDLSETKGDLASLVQRYDTVLCELMEKHAPEVERCISLRPHAPWYSDSIRNEKRKKRRLERKMLKSGLQIDKEIFQEHCDNYHKTLERAKRDHYKSKFDNCNQKQLFQMADKLSSAKATKTLPSHVSLQSLTEDFHQFFDSKIEKIRDELANCTPPPMSVDIKDSCESSFSNFDPVDCEDVRKIIMDSAKTSCPLDPIPTWILTKPSSYHSYCQSFVYWRSYPHEPETCSCYATDQEGKCRSWYLQKLSANIKSALLIQDYWTCCKQTDPELCWYKQFERIPPVRISKVSQYWDGARQSYKRHFASCW